MGAALLLERAGLRQLLQSTPLHAEALGSDPPQDWLAASAAAVPPPPVPPPPQQQQQQQQQQHAPPDEQAAPTGTARASSAEMQPGMQPGMQAQLQAGMQAGVQLRRERGVSAALQARLDEPG